MNKIRNILILLSVIFTITACGTTSSMHASIDGDTLKKRPDLSKYSKIVVEGFGDKITEDGDDSLVLDIGDRFADIIEFEIKKTRSFKKVSGEIDDVDDDTLLITGDITKYKEGNQVLRGLIGMGAGSSGFDANVLFLDSASGNKIGEIEVDKNSWLLGGTLAASQTVDILMQSAAKKIASEVAKAKFASLERR